MQDNHEQSFEQRFPERFEQEQEYDLYTENADIIAEMLKRQEQQKADKFARFPMFNAVFRHMYGLFSQKKAIKITLAVITLVYFLSIENIGTGIGPFARTLIDSLLPAFMFLIITPVSLAISLLHKSYMPFKVLFVFGTLKSIAYQQYKWMLGYFSVIVIVLIVFSVKKALTKGV